MTKKKHKIKIIEKSHWWCLQEDIKESASGETSYVSYHGSLYFKISDYTFVHNIEKNTHFTDDDEKEASITEAPYIIANLMPYELNVRIRQESEIKYSLFGSSRFIKEFKLEISISESDESIAIQGFDYSDSDFPSFEDCLVIEIKLSKEKFENIFDLLSNNKLVLDELIVNMAKGFYVDESYAALPFTEIPDKLVKVLLPDKVYEKVYSDYEFYSEDKASLEPHRVGEVGKFNLIARKISLESSASDSLIDISGNIQELSKLIENKFYDRQSYDLIHSKAQNEILSTLRKIESKARSGNIILVIMLALIVIEFLR